METSAPTEKEEEEEEEEEEGGTVGESRPKEIKEGEKVRYGERCGALKRRQHRK